MLEEILLKTMVNSYAKELSEISNAEVVIVGAGPAGLTAAYYLAKNEFRVSVIEKELFVGGGLWGGGMLFNKGVFQSFSQEILDELGINYTKYKNYFLANTVEVVTKLTSKAIDKGAKIFNGIICEGYFGDANGLEAITINWNAVDKAQLHVDPIPVTAKAFVDATGYLAFLISNIQSKDCEKKQYSHLYKKNFTLGVIEEDAIKNTRKVFGNFYVCGMAANYTSGTCGCKLAPVFGGMLLSGKKIAETIYKNIGNL